MSDLDVVKLGASKRDEDTNAPVVQALSDLDPGDTGDVDSLGEVDVYGALGVTAMPAPANDDGFAEGVVARGLGNSNGAVIGARDTRTTAVAAELGPGETCLHSTGEDYDSRVFCKDQLVAVVVGDDMAAVFDRKNQKVTINVAGLHFEMSEKQGILLSQGGAGVHITNGSVFITGKVVLGGRNASPASAVAFAPGPVVGVSGATVPSQTVFVGL